MTQEKHLFTSHIGKKVSGDDVNLFVEAVSTVGIEATGYLWLQWWFNNKDTLTITHEDREKMIAAAESNSVRIFRKIVKSKF